MVWIPPRSRKTWWLVHWRINYVRRKVFRIKNPTKLSYGHYLVRALRYGIVWMICMLATMNTWLHLGRWRCSFHQRCFYFGLLTTDQWGSISSRWRHWSRMIVLDIRLAKNIFLISSMRHFHPGYVQPSSDLFTSGGASLIGTVLTVIKPIEPTSREQICWVET